MRTNPMKIAALFCVLCCCLSAVAQQGGGVAKLNTLVNDVQKAIPNASLSDDQKTKIQADIDTIKSLLQAAQEGARPDRNKMMSTVADMRTIVDGGAFKKEDQDSLDKEFDGLMKR